MNQDAAISIALRLVDQATAPMNQAMAMVERSTQAAEQRMQALQSITRMAVGTFGALIGSLGISEILKTADTWKNLHGRLDLVTESASQLADVEQRLFAVAQDTRQGYEQTADLYARIARSTQEMNLGQEKTLTITDTINKSLIVSGAASESANAAIIQLGQGFASGVLRGEELNSVLEQAPRLAQAIAEGMGVTVGQLRALGKEGKLTAESVAEALVSQADAVTAEFEKMPKTVSQATTVFTNKLGQIISKVDEATGFTSTLSAGIISLADNLETIVQVITPLPVLLFGLNDSIAVLAATIEPMAKFLMVGGVLYGGLVGLPLILAAVETGVGLFAAAIAGATLTTGLFTTAILANPILAGIVVATGVIAYLWQYVDAADAATDKTADWNQQVEEIGRNSENITEFQSKLSTLQEEANKKLREDSWLYQLQKWTGGIWIEEKLTGLLKRGQELGLTDSDIGREAMKTAHRVDPFPGKTFDMALVDQGSASLEYSGFLDQVKNKVRSLVPVVHELTKAEKDAQTAAKRAAEAHLRDIESTMSRLLPLKAEQKEYIHDLAILDELYGKGKLSVADYITAQDNLIASTTEYKAIQEAVKKTDEEAKKAKEELYSAYAAYSDLVLASLPEEEQAVARVTKQYRAMYVGVMDAFNAGAAKSEEAEALISRLEVRELEALANLKNKGKTTAEELDAAFSGWANNMSRDLNDILWGADMTFSSILESFAKMITQMQIQASIVQPMMASFNSAGGASGIMSGFGAFLGGIWPFADGGVMTGDGAIPLHKYANGGVAYTPQLAMFGEGSRPEAYVPLPDGRSIPVTMSGGGNVQVIVNNNASGTQAQARERTDGGGNRIIEVFIEQVKGAIASDISRGDGAIPAALGSTYALNRVAGAY